MGWEINNYGGEYSPIADNGDVYISPGYDPGTIEIEGQVDNWGNVKFYIPVSVMRAWLQEWEKNNG